MAQDSSNITAAILAGGEGRRVGGNDKGLLVLGSLTLVEHVFDVLRGQVGEIIVCANRHHDEYMRCGRVIADEKPGFHGPLAGIATALTHCDTPWLLTVPVDAPSPPLDLAQRLWNAAEEKHADAAVAHDGERRQPLFALYRRHLAQSAAIALAADHSVHRWQDAVGAIEVDFSGQAQSFVNLNTLAEVREWERRHAD
jgi:molybdopterin-guanine dinucleotide biosynthesis protein A